MDTLLPEDLLLLLLDDTTGRLTHTGYLDTGIGGGLLVELALAGHVEVTKGSGLWASAKVRPVGGARPRDPLLGEALELVAAKERTATDLVGRLGRHRREQLLERLASRGVLRREQDRVLGLFPRDRWPAADIGHETDVRRRLADVLLRGVTPDERTAALVALLSAMDLAHRVLDREGLSSREVKRRAREVAEGDWAAKAVKDAIAAAQAAVAAATLAATTAATTSS
jgi:hypothetical protein